MTNKVLEVIATYAKLSFGTFLYCVCWDAFMIPNGFVGGGLTGLCTLIQFATGGFISVDVSYIVANVILMIIAVAILGKVFGARTIYCIALATVLFRVLPNVDFLNSLPGHFLYVPEKVLIPLIAGAIEAWACSIIFSNGGSTGGSDIVALITNKYWPISPGKVFLYMDIFIIASAMLLPGKTFGDTIYGYLMMLSFTFLLDRMLIGNNSSVQVLIFSKEYEKIADYLMIEQDKGVTAISAMGWYTKNENKVLMIITRARTLHELTKAVKKLDPKAFVSVSPATNVYGEGFDEIKVGFEKKNK